MIYVNEEFGYSSTSGFLASMESALNNEMSIARGHGWRWVQGMEITHAGISAHCRRG
jgi:hypothetical protein